jgi:hypothetical protein
LRAISVCRRRRARWRHARTSRLQLLMLLVEDPRP